MKTITNPIHNIVKGMILILLVVLTSVSASSPFTDPQELFLAGSGSSSTTLWASVGRHFNSSSQGVDLFLPNDAYSSDEIIPLQGRISGSYEYVFLAGAGGSSSTLWACAPHATENRIDCFLPNDSYSNEIVPIRGSLTGDYNQLFMAGGGSSSTLWACATTTTNGGGIDCFLPNDSYSDEILTVRGSLSGSNYQNLFMAGGSSSSTLWACASNMDTNAIDCFLPNDSYSDPVLSVKGSLSGGSYQNLFLAGGGSTVWACASTTTTENNNTQIDCFLPNDSYSNPVLQVQGSVMGSYSELFMASGSSSSSTTWACAIRQSSGNAAIDCFLPTDAYSNPIIPVKGTVSGAYKSLFMAGAGSSTVWACAIRLAGDDGIDCFLPSDAYADPVIPIRGSVQGRHYETLFLGGGGSTVWACAATPTTAGGGVDCFLPGDAYSNPTIPVRGTYYFPTPSPTMAPSVSPMPTTSPSMAPSPSPTISPEPTVTASTTSPTDATSAGSTLGKCTMLFLLLALLLLTELEVNC